MLKTQEDVLKTILALAESGLNGGANNAFDKLTKIFSVAEKVISKKGTKNA